MGIWQISQAKNSFLFVTKFLFFFLFNFIFLSRMAQPAELTLGQAAKNVEDRIAELERKAGGEDDKLNRLIDEKLKELKALFDGLKLQG